MRKTSRKAVKSETPHLEEYLDQSLIRNANLSGFSTKIIHTLEYFGIETAKDVMRLKTLRVTTIDPVLKNRLFAWRDGLMTSFTPKRRLSDSERNRIASRIAPSLLPLAGTIQTAIRDLEGIIGSHRTREQELLKNITDLVEDAAVSEAHLKALRCMIPSQ